MATARRTTATIGVCLAITMGVGVEGSLGMDPWVPPPPEFPDLTSVVGVSAYVHKWDPSLGAPASLLDVLPAGSPAVGDFNRDGAADLFIPVAGYTDPELQDARAPRSKLFLNDWTDVQQKRLLDVTDVSGIDAGQYAYSASWGDVDADGYVDLFVGGYRLAQLFRNEDGMGTFEEITDDAGLPQDGFTLGTAWGDYDGDGDLDLALAQFAQYDHPDDGLPADDFSDLAGASNVLLRNNGDGTFTDVSAATGLSGVERRSTTVSFVDVDDDGLVDLFFTNYGEPAEYWHNDGGGTFIEMAAAAGLADGAGATCQAWEDFDRDGDLDLYVAHEAGVRDGLWVGTGPATFADVSASIPGLDVTEAGRGWGCTPFDHDGNAAMDVFVARSRLTGDMAELPSFLTNEFNEIGTLDFADNLAKAGDGDPVAFAAFDNIASPRAASGVVMYDFNLDAHAPGAGKGAQDLVTVNGDGDVAHLFMNAGWMGGWANGNGDGLHVRLAGTDSNSLGVGAKVTVTAGTLASTRHLGAGSTWGSQLSLDGLQFGLAKPETFAYSTSSRSVSVRIEWPSGTVDEHLDQFVSAKGALFIEGQGFRRDFATPRPSLLLEDGDEGPLNWYTSEHLELRLVAQDLGGGGSEISGVSRVEWSLDGAEWTAVPCATNACFGGIGKVLTFDGEGTHRLWVRATDRAGNSAVTLFPVRIDTTPPEPGVVQPVHGSLYAQGREVAALGDASPVARAVVIAPVALRRTDVAAELQPLEDLVGSDGTQRIVVRPIEDGSGIARVDLAVTTANGVALEGMQRSWTLPPFEYAWPASELKQGTYFIEVTVHDVAGHASEQRTNVLLVAQPSAPEPPPPPALGPRTGPPSDATLGTIAWGRAHP